VTERRWLVLILILFTILGVFYAVVTPVFEASDELWHYPMVKHLADGNALPVQVFDPDQAGPWKQEASQPPLYYYLGAALTFWIDTSDIENVRWLNPHVDSGVITEDGNTNLVVHDPTINPWSGTSLAIRIVRLASVLLGSATVYLTFRIAKEVVPERPEIYLVAAAINAFTPMFLFISGAVNNDNLVIPLSSLALFMIIKLGRAFAADLGRRKEIIRLILLGSVIGLGALTKITAIGLIPLAVFGIAIGLWRRTPKSSPGNRYLWLIRETLWRSAVFVVPALLIAGWWYSRNIQLYGDWSGWNAFIAVLGKRATPANLAQLWDERWGFLTSYWGLFGGLNVPMTEWIYKLLNTLLLISVVGFVAFFIRIVVSWWSDNWPPSRKLADLLKRLISFVADNFALIICLLWTAAVIVGLIRWATVTWSSQGRLVFSSISALSTLFVVGLVGWMKGYLARVVVAAVAGFMFTISLLAPFIWIQPAYSESDVEPPINQVVDVRFDNSMRLTGYSIERDSILPGESIEIALQWEVLNAINRDWSVFIHLNDPQVELPAAQRDMYPGQGLLSTRLLVPGQTLTERYVLEIPPTADSPADLDLMIGLYDFDSGDRLKTSTGLDAVKLSDVALLAHPGSIPNPTRINFEDSFELVGFAAAPRRLAPSETIELSLYWRSSESIEQDYTFFAQVVDNDTTRWASQDLLQPTSAWQMGEIEEISLSLPLSESTPSGIYPIIIGIYLRTEDGGFDRLQRTTSEGRLTDDFLELVQIRVD
jgi:hypothetical protein